MPHGHIHFIVEEEPGTEKYGGPFAIYLVARTRREHMGYRKTRLDAETEAAIYERFQRREDLPDCKYCKAKERA